MSAEPASDQVAALARDLDTLRRSAGLSFRGLARRSGCPASTLNDALRGRRFPRLATVLAIAQACGSAPEPWRRRWMQADADRAAPRPAQLPTDLTTFTGRDDQLARIAALVDEGEQATTVIAITGPAGAGKTALAVHAARQLTPRFPDAQLFVDLLGSTRGTAPADALARLLRSLGVPDADMPSDVDDRAALFRSRVANRRMLVVLDDAQSPDQVRPLLPGSAGTLVLVTSRQTLAGLAAANDARLLGLDRLTHSG